MILSINSAFKLFSPQFCIFLLNFFTVFNLVKWQTKAFTRGTKSLLFFFCFFFGVYFCLYYCHLQSTLSLQESFFLSDLFFSPNRSLSLTLYVYSLTDVQKIYTPTSPPPRSGRGGHSGSGPRGSRVLPRITAVLTPLTLYHFTRL